MVFCRSIAQCERHLITWFFGAGLLNDSSCVDRGSMRHARCGKPNQACVRTWHNRTTDSERISSVRYALARSRSATTQMAYFSLNRL